MSSLERGCEMLRRIATGPQTLASLGEALGVHKTTAMRLLRTLEAYGLVTHDDEHQYRLGPTLFALAHEALDGVDLREAARPVLRRLNEQTGLTIHLAALHDDDIIYVDKCEGRNPVRMYSRVGLPVPLASAAVGKAIVAYLAPQQADRIVDRIRFEPRTPTSIRSADDYRSILAEVRAVGYACDRGEMESFVNCVGVPIFGLDRAVVGGISMTAATTNSSLDGVLAELPRLRSAAGVVSASLGGSHDGR